MNYLGEYTPGKTVRCRFNTHKADGTPITLAGTPAISVYKGSTTESTTGVTLTVDYDARTGLHDVVIDTSADGTFYAAGNDFDLILTAGTVDTISVVGSKVGMFSLSNRAFLRPTTADRTLDVSAGGEAGLDWANVGSPGSTVALSATTIPSLAPASTALSTVQWTNARAAALDNLDVIVSSRSTYAGGDTAGTTALLSRLTSGRATNLDNLDVAVSTRLASASYTAPPSAATVAGLVWDVILSGHVIAGSAGVAMAAASSAGDPWSTPIPGTYATGTAGAVLGSKSGYSLGPLGLDEVMVETNTNARQALSYIGAATAGKGGSTSGSYKGLGVDTVRITFTAAGGERTLVSLSPP